MGYLSYQLVQEFSHQPYHDPLKGIILVVVVLSKFFVGRWVHLEALGPWRRRPWRHCGIETLSSRGGICPSLRTSDARWKVGISTSVWEVNGGFLRNPLKYRRLGGDSK